MHDQQWRHPQFRSPEISPGILLIIKIIQLHSAVSISPMLGKDCVKTKFTVDHKS